MTWLGIFRPQFAIVRALEIVGEAAARVTPPTRAAHPEIPWSAVVGMRNRPVHGYFDVDLAIVWRTATESLPVLIEALEKILTDESPPTQVEL